MASSTERKESSSLSCLYFTRGNLRKLMNISEVELIVNSSRKTLIGIERRNKISESLKDKQIEVMWDLSFDSKGDSKVPVKCLLDNEYTIHNIGNLVRGNFTCIYCFTDKYRKLFSDKGFKYLHKSTVNGTIYVTGECFKCLSNTTIARSNLLSRYKVTCQTCEHKRIIDALLIKDCEYVSERLVKFLKRVTYKNSKGEIFENGYSNILRGNFTNGGSHWDQRHSLYLISCKFNGDIYYKIGTANDPKNRLSILKLLGESSVTTLEVFETRYAADQQESYLHRLFNNFNLDKNFTAEFTTGLSKTGKKAGVTEWFSKDILPELEEIYKLKDKIWQ